MKYFQLAKAKEYNRNNISLLLQITQQKILRFSGFSKLIKREHGPEMGLKKLKLFAGTILVYARPIFCWVRLSHPI